MASTSTSTRADRADGRPDQEEGSFDDDLRNKLHAALKEYSANFKAELEAAVKA
jgi:hypothetical protein